MLVAEAINKATEFPAVTENTAVGAAGQALRKQVCQELVNIVKDSVYWPYSLLLQKIKSQLSSIGELESNWDTYGAPAPNQVALDNAGRILKHMAPFDLALVNIVPSAEGGVGFCFSVRDRYADLESSNEGDILGVKYVGTQTPVLIQADGTDASIEDALEQIRTHIGA
jgi:hypothetical protein